jgi:hypothetical protein
MVWLNSVAEKEINPTLTVRLSKEPKDNFNFSKSLKKPTDLSVGFFVSLKRVLVDILILWPD